MAATEYRLYVPAAGATTGIDDGSAIVGEPEGDRIGVDFERGGNAVNVQTFEEKILHAAGRRAQRYPTIARRSYPASDLVEVDAVRYDGALRRWVIADIYELDTLEAWAPGPHHIGGSPALLSEAAGIGYSQLSSNERLRVATKQMTGSTMRDAILSVLRDKDDQQSRGIR
jgi:hypothetical protein